MSKRLNKLQRTGLFIMAPVILLIFLGGYAVHEYWIDDEYGFWTVTSLSAALLITGMLVFFRGGSVKPVGLASLVGLWTVVVMAFIFIFPFLIGRIKINDFDAALFSASAIIVATFAALFNTVNYIMAGGKEENNRDRYNY